MTATFAKIDGHQITVGSFAEDFDPPLVARDGETGTHGRFWPAMISGMSPMTDSIGFPDTPDLSDFGECMTHAPCRGRRVRPRPISKPRRRRKGCAPETTPFGCSYNRTTLPLWVPKIVSSPYRCQVRRRKSLNRSLIEKKVRIEVVLKILDPTGERGRADRVRTKKTRGNQAALA